MKRIGLLLLVAFLFSYSQVFADNGTSIVKFGDLHGEVNVRPNSEDDDAYIFAELATPLHHDDRIKTLTRSGAILSFADMTTFVLKEDTTIVLDIANEKTSKVGLLAGNIWVNLKKMAADGSLEVEMGQAVAGIKGTNITCSTSSGEDRVQVLRGIASILIKETREIVELQEGEELIIKKGAKPEKKEIDVAAEQKKWEEDISRLGESIELNEVPDVLKGILESETAEFSRINEAFTRMLAQTTVEEAEVLELQKDAERFLGIILEDNLILGSMRKKVDLAMQTPGLPAPDAVRIAGLLREIAAVLARVQANQAQAAKIIRYQFKLSAVINEELQTEIELVSNELAQTVSEVDAVRAVISSSPNGNSQDWFIEAQQTCSLALASLEPLLEKVSALISENPTSVEAQALLKSITDQQVAISTLMRSLAVVEIDSATITELSQIDDTLSDQIVVLQNEITAYNALSDSTVAEKETRFVSSVKIMSNFAKVRRQYTNAQRLYETTAKATSSSKFRTAEMDEVDSVYNRITDNFQQLGIAAEELELNIRDLESQLSTYLK